MTLAFVQNISLWQILLIGLAGLVAFGVPVLVVYWVVRLAVRGEKRHSEGTPTPMREPATTAKD
jgi:hypothetical protein